MNPLIKSGQTSTLRYLLLAASLSTYLLIVAGLVIRYSGAGPGCPDWPTCYGQWGVPVDLSAQLHYAHRALALLSVVLVLASAVFAAWRSSGPRWLRTSLYVAVFLLVIEAGLGRQSGALQASAAKYTLHLGLALCALALTLASTLAAYYQSGDPKLDMRLRFRTPFGRVSLVAFAAVFGVMVSGVYLVSASSSPTCFGWPLCSGGLPGNQQGWVEFSHRLLTGLATLLVVGLLISAWRRRYTQRVTLSAATATALLFFGQALIGALKVLRGYPNDLVGLHAVIATSLFGILVILVVSTGLERENIPEETAKAGVRDTHWQRALDFFTLTKPVIVALLLVTTYAGMVVGGRGFPAFMLTFWTMLGGALAAGGASAINQYIDRDLDRNMQRTARRPLAAGRMTPAEGLAYGLGLCLAGFLVMASFVNLLAAVLSLAGMVYYVLLYSIFLKRVTVQNIVIGGGAGAIPPLVGWAAATGSLAIPSLFLFAIVFLWTPPHFWALALVRRKDYARAGVPMLPVVKGEQATREQIFIYTIELVGLTLLMPVFRMTGSLFLVSAVTLGGLMLYSAWRVLRQGGNRTAYSLYRFSSMYLLLIFLALALDVVVKL
ncbi:MAG: heme o synthase [Anaerolineaceae bacterium]|nr:heme o synthase [Anaerolineaceae bacterium]